MTEPPVPAIINYALLKYARKKKKLSLQDAAKDILPVDQLREAEANGTQITFDQFHQLADRYDRPITFFYLNQLPSLKTRFGWWREHQRTKILRWLIKRWGFENNLNDLEAN